MDHFVLLRQELQTQDLLLLMKWMSNEHIYRYLNEQQQIAAQLKQIYDARLPSLSPLLNQNGRFLMICTGSGQAIGFLRIVHAQRQTAEVVLAIGEESMWGHRYGGASLTEALKIVFFEMRKTEVVAHIANKNGRSQHMFASHGFVPCAQSDHSTKYRLTLEDYLHPPAAGQHEIA